jgi:hypothetical protein
MQLTYVLITKEASRGRIASDDKVNVVVPTVLPLRQKNFFADGIVMACEPLHNICRKNG